MKRFFKNIFIFLIVNLLIAISLLYYIDKNDSSFSFKQSETESALYSMPKDSSVDILIMGSSHGRMLTRGICDSITKSYLGKNIVNISKSASGIVPEYEFLKYFYSKNNSCKTILYVIDPFIFYTKKWNEDLYFLTDEPFRFDFFGQILFSKLNNDVKYNYIKSKFLTQWKTFHGSQLPDVTKSLEEIDNVAISKRKSALYISTDDSQYILYKQKLIQLINFSQKQNCKLYFILTPTLLGDMKGKHDLLNLIAGLKSKGLITDYANYSDLIENPELYYDTDHLNATGIDYFAKNYLKDFLKN